jgi:hypothetical protein
MPSAILTLAIDVKPGNFDAAMKMLSDRGWSAEACKEIGREWMKEAAHYYRQQIRARITMNDQFRTGSLWWSIDIAYSSDSARVGVYPGKGQASGENMYHRDPSLYAFFLEEGWFGAGFVNDKNIKRKVPRISAEGKARIAYWARSKGVFRKTEVIKIINSIAREGFHPAKPFWSPVVNDTTRIKHVEDMGMKLLQRAAIG